MSLRVVPVFRHSKLHWKADESCVAGTTPANIIATVALVAVPAEVSVAVTPPAMVVELIVVTLIAMVLAPTDLKVTRYMPVCTLSNPPVSIA